MKHIRRPKTAFAKMMKHKLSVAVKWLGGHELMVLLAVLVVVAGTWGFIALADVVFEGRTQSFDESLLLALRRPDNPALPIGPDWMVEVGRDLTAVGGVAVLLLATLAVAGFLLLDRKFAAMGFVLAAVAGGLAASSLLKACASHDRGPTSCRTSPRSTPAVSPAGIR